MEGLTTRVYEGVKGYWRTRGYQRLGVVEINENESSTYTSKPRRRRRKRRLWRIKISLKLKLKLPLNLRGSPRKLFIGLRDAYMRIMMKLSNSSVVRGRTMMGHGGEGFGTITMMKEYDEKMIMEIYKTLTMTRKGQLVPSEIACQIS